MSVRNTSAAGWKWRIHFSSKQAAPEGSPSVGGKCPVTGSKQGPGRGLLIDVQ